MMISKMTSSVVNKIRSTMNRELKSHEAMVLLVFSNLSFWFLGIFIAMKV